MPRILLREQPFEDTVNSEVSVVVQGLEQFLVVNAEVCEGRLPTVAGIL